MFARQLVVASAPQQLHHMVYVPTHPAGRMPSDPVAFAKTKAALGVQVASALTAACGAAVTATEEALEVLWQGYAFKLLLFMDR